MSATHFTQNDVTASSTPQSLICKNRIEVTPAPSGIKVEIEYSLLFNSVLTGRNIDSSDILQLH